MAITRQGSVVGEVSGSVGGVVFSRNRGGNYVRTRVKPSNPSTEYQVAVRNALSTASGDWKDLTDAQRAAWKSWADSNPIRNRLGESIRLQGNAAFVELNARLIMLGTASVATPPIVSAPDPLLTLTGSYDVGAGDFQVAYTATPLAAGTKLWVSGCLLSSASINFVQNRLRHFFTSAAAAASPAAIESAFTARFGTPQVGNKVVLTASVIDGTNGLMSSIMRDEGIVVST